MPGEIITIPERFIDILIAAEVTHVAYCLEKENFGNGMDGAIVGRLKGGKFFKFWMYGEYPNSVLRDFLSEDSVYDTLSALKEDATMQLYETCIEEMEKRL